MRLYVDDIEAMHRILTDNAEEVSIETDSFDLDAPKDLEEVEEDTVQSVTMQSTSPSLTLRLGVGEYGESEGGRIEIKDHEDRRVPAIMALLNRV